MCFRVSAAFESAKLTGTSIVFEINLFLSATLTSRIAEVSSSETGVFQSTEVMSKSAARAEVSDSALMSNLSAGF